MKKDGHRYKAGFLAALILKYLSLVLIAAVFITPILLVFFASFKELKEFYNTSKISLPHSFLNFANYIKAFTKGGMLKGLINTCFIMAVSLTGSILFGAMVGYVLSRFKFAAKKLVIGMYFTAYLIPMVTTQVATYKIIDSLGLFNTLWAAIVLYLGADVMSIFVMMQFIGTIHVSIDESAMLDGASYFTIFFKLILPLLKPAIATLVIIKGVAIYNDFYIPFLYMPGNGLQTLSTSLFRFMGPFGGEWNVICAGIILIMIPTTIAFLGLQKYMYSGFTQGAVK